MKARIIKCENWWYGEIYSALNIWETVTPNSYTRLGAKLALNIWIKQNIPKEFEI